MENLITACNSIDAAHAEALDINRWIDSTHNAGGVALEGASDVIIAVREHDHAEARKENARFDWLAKRFSLFRAATARVQLEMLEEAHHEALEINQDWNAKERHGRWCAFIGSNDYKARRAIIEAAHAEALEMDKQATHFRKEQAALTQRVAAIMGKTPV